MKKFITSILTVIILFSLLGCDKQTSVSTGAETRVTTVGSDSELNLSRVLDTDLKFTLIMETASGTSGAQFIAGFNRQCNELGITPIVSDAAGSQDKMVSMLAVAVNQNVDAIIINNGRADALIPGVETALKKGITVITKDVDLGLAGVSTVDQDDYLLALLSVKQMVADIDGTGNMVRGYAPGFVPQERRYDMTKLYLSRYPDINEVAEFGPVSASTALDSQTKMEAILKQYPAIGDIVAIWCGWEEWAKGAARAVMEAGRADEIKIYSTDMSDELLQMLQDPENPYTATAAIDIPMMAEVCVRMAVCDMAGEDVPAYYSFSGTLVKKSDLPSDKIITTDDLPEIIDGWGENNDFRPVWMENMN
ncbi:MAG: substrate-binding domain-containing protein [Spirochaetales bacterium]